MTDERLENIVGGILRSGVVLSAVVVLAGGIWYLVAHGWQPVRYAHFAGRTRGFRGLPPSESVILVGLMMLIATPVVRVAFSLIAFALERDRLYVFLTAIVLSVLIYSIGTAWW
jgi:uncharacterized membrane protein